MARHLDIGGLTGVFALVAGAAAFLGQWLSRTVNPARYPSIELVGLLTGTVLLSTVAVALGVALAARIVAITGDFASGFWPNTATILQDYALFLSIWTIIWGIPFVVGMFVTTYLNQVLVVGVALGIGIAAGILVLLGLRRFLSQDVWRVIGEFNPGSRLGNLRMLLLLLAFLWVARLHVNRCYVFDVSVPSTSVLSEDPIEVHARVSGRLADHARLRVQVTPSGAVRAIRTQRFAVEDVGSYLALVDTARFKPGLYRVRVYFEPVPPNSRWTTWSPPYDDVQRTILVRVRPNTAERQELCPESGGSDPDWMGDIAVRIGRAPRRGRTHFIVGS